MDYCLDAGDGTASIWTGRVDVDVDGDGVFDGVRLDVDGDGFFDDALADLDGDGLADHAAMDLTGEAGGRLRTDDGTGTWALNGGVASGPVRWFGLDGVEHPGDVPADVDGDGRTDRVLDTDDDGLADRAVRTGDAGGPTTGYVDTDADGRWDLTLRDSDGDGRADGAAVLGPPDP